MMLIDMHTALISFAVYEEAEIIRKKLHRYRLQNMKQKLYPAVPVGT